MKELLGFGWLAVLKSASWAESPHYLKKQIGIKQIGYEQLAQTLAFTALAVCVLPTRHRAATSSSSVPSAVPRPSIKLLPWSCCWAISSWERGEGKAGFLERAQRVYLHGEVRKRDWGTGDWRTSWRNWVLEAWRSSEGCFFSSWHQTWECMEERTAQCGNRQSFQLYFVFKKQGFWLTADSCTFCVAWWEQLCSLLGSVSQCLAVAWKLSWKRLMDVTFEMDFFFFFLLEV